MLNNINSRKRLEVKSFQVDSSRLISGNPCSFSNEQGLVDGEILIGIEVSGTDDGPQYIIDSAEGLTRCNLTVPRSMGCMFTRPRPSDWG